MSALPWHETDGGRLAAGFLGMAPGDCVCRAIAVVTERPYREVYSSINAQCRERYPTTKLKQNGARTGLGKADLYLAMEAAGGVWHPTMKVGQGCTVHLAEGELPDGRLVANLSRHVVAVIDGVAFDTYDPSRGGTRCVYGFWRFPS